MSNVVFMQHQHGDWSIAAAFATHSSECRNLHRTFKFATSGHENFRISVVFSGFALVPCFKVFVACTTSPVEMSTSSLSMFPTVQESG